MAKGRAQVFHNRRKDVHGHRLSGARGMGINIPSVGRWAMEVLKGGHIGEEKRNGAEKPGCWQNVPLERVRQVDAISEGGVPYEGDAQLGEKSVIARSASQESSRRVFPASRGG